MQQGRVLDDQRVRLHDRLTQTDFLVRDATECHNRRPGPFGTETGKCLRVTPFFEGSDRQHLCRGHHALAASAMNTYLEHVFSSS